MDNENARGVITVEMSMVLVVVMLIVAALISSIIYVHDVTVAKSISYSGAIEVIEKTDKNPGDIVRKKLRHAPLFIMTFDSNIEENLDSYTVNLSGRVTDSNVLNIVKKYLDYNTSFTLEKPMSVEFMYASIAICDVIRNDE